jgi:hypothetical protein
MSTPVRSACYRVGVPVGVGVAVGVGVGVGVGLGVGVAAVQFKSDSWMFPGRFEDAPKSSQLPLVTTKNCWRFLLTTVAVTMTVPQENDTVSVPALVAPWVWLLTKCQVPFPLHVVPIWLGFKVACARACGTATATATRASTDSNRLTIVVRFIYILLRGI